MRQEMEALLYQYNVDIVFSGHVSWSFFCLSNLNKMHMIHYHSPFQCLFSGDLLLNLCMFDYPSKFYSKLDDCFTCYLLFRCMLMSE